MEDLVNPGLTPTDDDPELDRRLSGLPHFAPRTDRFDDHVMARVRRPYPGWALRIRDAGRVFLESHRVWWTVGMFAAGSVVTIVASVALADAFDAQIAAGWRWLSTTGLPTARAEVVRHTQDGITTLSAYLGGIVPGGPARAALGVGGVVVLAGCAWGLRRAMKPGALMRR